LKKLNKISIPVMTLAMSFGIMSVGHAQTIEQLPSKNLQIEVAATEKVISKNDVIKKFKELFPNKFDYLTVNDFYMSTSHYYPDKEIIRYDLSFSKLVQGKYVNGSATFSGDNLELESFYFDPISKKDALFPAKITKAEAQKVAQDFIKTFSNGKKYQLDTSNNDYYFYYSNQLLTEPIQYYFSFVPTENNIEIDNQQMIVVVLGNGEIVQFYNYAAGKGKATFEKAENLVKEKDVLSKIKENMNLQLQYQVSYDFRTDKRDVNLVYTPVTQFSEINAVTGQWYTNNGFTDTLPENKKIEKLVQEPLKPRQEDITVEDAKAIANKLLAIDSDKVKLRFDSIEENEDENGREIISLHYSYEYKNGGYGTMIELDKQTGEIIQYHNLKDEVLSELGEGTSSDKKLTSSEALSKAMDYVKEWLPSTLHNYIKPIAEPYTDEERGTYEFTFPRIVNGIVVSGNEISVGINFNGELKNIYVNALEIDEWPTTDGILSKQEAEKIFNESLNLKLRYIKENISDTNEHYSLVYHPVYSEKSAVAIDAKSGDWTSLYGGKEYPIVSHSTAEEELNYLIQNNILEVEDSNFNADISVSRGEALKILIKSISYFYEGDTPQQEESHQSFEDIGPDNPYYSLVESAVSMGILDTNSSEFIANKDISREELAVWYVRALGLEQAAKHSELYNLSAIKDAKDVSYKGYVALANALEVLPAEKGLFKPKKSVTYAELAISTIQLAHKIYENDTYRY